MSTDEQINEAKPEFSTTWSPEIEGDYVVGKCCHIDYDTPSQYGGNRMLIKIDARKAIQGGVGLAPGTYAIWERAQLKRSVEEKSLAAGDEVLVKYTGVPPGKEFKSFAVIVEHPESSEPEKEPHEEIPF